MQSTTGSRANTSSMNTAAAASASTRSATRILNSCVPHGTLGKNHGSNALFAPMTAWCWSPMPLAHTYPLTGDASPPARKWPKFSAGPMLGREQLSTRPMWWKRVACAAGTTSYGWCPLPPSGPPRPRTKPLCHKGLLLFRQQVTPVAHNRGNGKCRGSSSCCCLLPIRFHFLIHPAPHGATVRTVSEGSTCT